MTHCKDDFEKLLLLSKNNIQNNRLDSAGFVCLFCFVFARPLNGRNVATTEIGTGRPESS